MSDNSKQTVLGDLVDLQRGVTYKSRLLGEPGPVLLGLASIQRNGGFRTDSLKTYGGNSPLKLLLRPGDLFVSLKDVTQSGDLTGAVARVPSEIPEGRLTQDTVKLVFKNNSIPAEYVYWLLRSPQYRKQCRNAAIGTTNLSLRREDFLNLPVPPPTDESLGLVALFEAIESKILLNQQMNETVEKVARAMFKQWFADFQFPNWNGELVNGLPNGWRTGKVKDVCGVNLRSLGSKDVLERIDYVEISEVFRGVINNVSRYIRGEEPSRARRRLSHGDTVLSTVRPDRGSYFLAFNPEDSVIASTGFAVFSPSSVPYSFLFLFLTAFEQLSFYGKSADGAAYPAINPSVIMNMDIVIPDDSVLDLFHAIANPIFERIDSNLKQNSTLREIRDCLLPKLVSGNLVPV